MRIGPPTVVRLTVTRVFVLLAAILLLTGSVQSPVHGQSAGPPCQLVTTVPYHNIDTVCIEIMYDHITAPEAVPELTGLALAPDGTLYFARTASGEIWTMRDEDGDHFMEEPSLFADGLRFPTQMAVYDGAVYALAADGVWRLVDTDSDHAADSRVLVVDDLPNDAGFWPGAVGIGPDERLYVSVGAGCYACQDADARPGQLLSYALDGDDRRVEASGLRYPADFDWHPVTGDLWIVDSGVVEPAIGVEGLPDELNLVIPGADYGFPVCEDCEQPSVTFPHQSTPTGIAFYPGDAFPNLADDLIVALNGSWTTPEPRGYALAAAVFDEAGQPDGLVRRIAPASQYSTYFFDPLEQFSLSGRGFFPQHPFDVVVSSEGWIYLSVQEGRILRFRPKVR